MARNTGRMTSATERHDAVNLVRRFGLVQSVAIISGIMVGTGIYLSPSYVARMVQIPGLILMMWTLAGLTNLLGGLQSAELGTTYPKIGDIYVFMEIFYNEFFAYMWLWAFLFVSRTGSNAVRALLAGSYLTFIFFPDCQAPEAAIKLLAIVLISLVTFINSVNVKFTGRFQAGCAAVVAFMLVITIALGFKHISEGHMENLSEKFTAPVASDIGSIFLAFYTILYSYSGWFALNHMVEEVEKPEKTLPRAVVITVVGVTILYVLTNLSFLVVLGSETITNSPAVAMTFARQTLGRAYVLMPIAIVITCCGALNSSTMIGSRLGFAGARRGHLPAYVSLISMKSLSPVVALILKLIIVIPMILFVDVYSLLSNAMFLTVLSEMLIAYGLVYRRLKEPDLHRPFKLPICLHVTYALIQTVLVAVPLITKPYQSATGLLLSFVISVPYYLLFVKKVIRSTTLNKYSRMCLVRIQKVLWSAPQDHPAADRE